MGTISVTVDIDPWQVLEEVSTKDLAEELAARRKEAEGPRSNEELRDIIRVADADTALRLERIFFPKFRSSEMAQKAYQRAMQERAA